MKKTGNARLRRREKRAVGPALGGLHAPPRPALGTSAHFRGAARDPPDSLEAELPRCRAAEAARRAKKEDRDERDSREPHRYAGGQRPTRGQEKCLEGVDAHDASDQRTHEAEGADEGRSAGEHADGEEGEGEVEVREVVRQEEDGDADEERQGDRAEDRDAKPCERVANGDHGSSGPPHDVRRTISTCRHRWSELIISTLPDPRAEGHALTKANATPWGHPSSRCVVLRNHETTSGF